MGQQSNTVRLLLQANDFHPQGHATHQTRQQTVAHTPPAERLPREEDG